MIVKVDRAAFEDAVAAFVCAARKCSCGHEWQPLDAPDKAHDLAVAAVRGALSTVFNAPVFVEDEHALGLPEERQ